VLIIPSIGRQENRRLLFCQARGFSAKNACTLVPQNFMTDYSLPGVLHFLQSEWRKFESLKNEWGIEKSDLLSQIVVLNGQKSNLEIINADLQKRIKMLEYALKKER
jgi:striatin 1/3/4